MTEMRRWKYGFQTKFGRTRITFKNGYTVSLFNGLGSHTDNKYNNILIDSEESGKPCESANIELAVLYGNQFVTNLFTKTMDGSVVGWVNPEEAVEILEKVCGEEPLDEIITPKEIFGD